MTASAMLVRVVPSRIRWTRSASSARRASAPLASARSRLLQICGREPTLDELAAEVGLPVAKAQMALLARREPVSLETPAGEDGNA